MQIKPLTSPLCRIRPPALRWALLGVAAAAVITSPSISEAKYASIVIDAKTGKVRHSVNANTRNFPASLTKIMTLYLLFEAVDTKKLTFESRLKVSRRAALQPASRLGLKPGQTIKVREAADALIIRSANDVATVVAEALAGSERRFALRMTQKAREIGMSRTTFRNASGLPHRGQMSTAKDMATLTRNMISRFPHHYHMFAKTSFSYQGRRYRSHNKLLKTYPGAEGFKTGYIRASGYNLITTAKQNGHRLIGVVFGGNSSRSRNRHMQSLLNKAYAQVRAVPSSQFINTPRRLGPGRKNQTGRSGMPKRNIWGIQ
ncbi:MAG: D-alanyl-D-alanine carboxypeptidase, partial [Rhodospirillales bacterium]|nr:D-alanyl-D-alanine carboxypeptidase [Rhodospirillales bacterium]